MLARINQARADIGRAPLTDDPGIAHVAVDWSDEMAGRQSLQHNPDYARQIGAVRAYRAVAENVGFGRDQAALFAAFMDSAAHRRNIESASYTHGVVGCVTDRSGQLWVTQNFWG